jgi:hypothetical protein
MHIFDVFTQLNYIGILISLVLSVVLGFFWYAPQIFGNTWATLAGVKSEQMSKMSASQISITLVGALLASVVLSYLCKIAGVDTLVGGLRVGIMAGLLTAYIGVNNTVFAGKSWKLFFIDFGYAFIYFALAGAIIGFSTNTTLLKSFY